MCKRDIKKTGAIGMEILFAPAPLSTLIFISMLFDVKNEETMLPVEF